MKEDKFVNLLSFQDQAQVTRLAGQHLTQGAIYLASALDFCFCFFNQ